MNKKKLFWADQKADEVIKRIGKSKKEFTIKCAASPSGGKHIGNLNDCARAYMIYRGVIDFHPKTNLRFIHVADDRDPLRKIPDMLPRLDGSWFKVDAKFKKEYTKYLGLPYVSVPDPFGCCESWAKHFNRVWLDSIYLLYINPENISSDEIYREGGYRESIRMALEKIEKSREIIQRFQETAGPDYIPFVPICENCGKIIAKPLEFDLDSWSIKYKCETKRLKGKYVAQGCGYEGETSLDNGKMPWLFEYAAQWKTFNVVCEPMGKDHAVGTWPASSTISREIFEREPPVTSVYEFFLVNKQKMSASKGNVYITQDIKKIMSPEIFLYFYTKKPKKQRDIDLRDLTLVREFEEIEDIYFGLRKAKTKKEEINVRRQYVLSWGDREVPKRKPLRIPYQYAAIIAQTVVKPEEELERALYLLRKTGHVDHRLSKEDKEGILERLKRAKYWAQHYAPESLRFKILEKYPKEIVDKLSRKQKEALREVGELLTKEFSMDELESKLFDIAKKHNLTFEQFFKAAYQVLLGKEEGPRLSPLLLSIKDLAIQRFKKIYLNK